MVIIIMKLSDYVFDFLSDRGLKHVFMLSGGGCMHLCDSLGRSKLSYVCCLHEQAAALAAVGYAQYTGNFGAVLVTSGPGGTNTITGIAAAYVDSVPLIVLSGQVKTSDMSKGTVRMKGFQEIDITSIIRPITKYAAAVTVPEDIRYHLEQALYLAKSGRPGPVLLDIPLDIQACMIDETCLRGFKGAPVKKQTDASVSEAAELLVSAKRPVIIAGYGIRTSGAADRFISLAEKIHVPVLTTWKAMDLMPENHPDFYGRPGNIAGRGPNFIQQNADLIIAVGARLDFGQIGYEQERFAVHAKKIIVDIDENELRKFKFNVEMPIPKDAGDFIGCLDDELGNFIFRDRCWLARCAEWKIKYPVIKREHLQMNGYVSQYALINFLSEKTVSTDVFAPGNSGGCSEIFMQAFKVTGGQRVISLNGIGSMGTGLPAALGAAVASGKRVICVNGDGGFQMNIQDLETIHRLNLPIKFFILNNNGYNSIRQTQTNYFSSFFVGSSPESGVTLPDVCNVANAYGVQCIRVSAYKELCCNADYIMDGDGPFICEVMVDPHEKTIPRLQSTMNEYGRMISGSQENLYPFLSDEELNNNILY
jgi:acetolactate synthase-1/2/3 large subunit